MKNDALAQINSLEGVELGAKNLNTQFALFLVAMEKTLSSLVKGEGGEKEISYIEVIPILVEVIKEQQRQIKALQEALNNKTNSTEKLDQEYDVKNHESLSKSYY